MAPTVIGIRHGEVHNPQKVIYAGLPEFGLSETGRQEAVIAASSLRGLDVCAVYVSPLQRARETAEAITAVTGVDPVVDERLHEWRFWTQWAGRTWQELRDEGPEVWDAYFNAPDTLVGDESLSALADRMEAWLTDVTEAHPSGVVVAVSHLEPLRALLCRRLGMDAKSMMSISIGHADAVRFSPSPDATPAPADVLVNAVG